MLLAFLAALACALGGLWLLVRQESSERQRWVGVAMVAGGIVPWYVFI